MRSWWLTGGIAPDHSVIGRFLNDHAERLSEEFFESLTREVLKVTRSSTQSLAGDGTVVQAAASRYRGVKQEAAEEAAKESRGRAEADPEDERLGRQAEQAEGVAQAVRERVATRKKQHSRKPKDAQVSPSEPEAVFQPLKDKSIAPSYKPTLLANQERIIVGQQVQASSETRGFGALLRQAKRINGGVGKRNRARALPRVPFTMMSRAIVMSARRAQSWFPWGKVTTTGKDSRATEGPRVSTAN